MVTAPHRAAPWQAHSFLPRSDLTRPSPSPAQPSTSVRSVEVPAHLPHHKSQGPHRSNPKQRENAGTHDCTAPPYRYRRFVASSSPHSTSIPIFEKEASASARHNRAPAQHSTAQAAGDHRVPRGRATSRDLKVSYDKRDRGARSFVHTVAWNQAGRQAPLPVEQTTRTTTRIRSIGEARQSLRRMQTKAEISR